MMIPRSAEHKIKGQFWSPKTLIVGWAGIANDIRDSKSVFCDAGKNRTPCPL
jgi:hypothetical protein